MVLQESQPYEYWRTVCIAGLRVVVELILVDEHPEEGYVDST